MDYNKNKNPKNDLYEMHPYKPKIKPYEIHNPEPTPFVDRLRKPPREYQIKEYNSELKVPEYKPYEYHEYTAPDIDPIIGKVDTPSPPPPPPQPRALIRKVPIPEELERNRVRIQKSLDF